MADPMTGESLPVNPRKRWTFRRMIDVLFFLPKDSCYVCGAPWDVSWLMGSGPTCGCEGGA